MRQFFTKRRILQTTILIASIVFLTWILWKDIDSLREKSFQVRYELLALSIPFFCLSIFFQFCSWHRLTSSLNIALSFPLSMRAWFISQFGKYIPGKVFLLLGRMSFYPKEHTIIVGTAFYLEILIAVITATFVSLACLSFSPTKDILGFDIHWLLFLSPMLITLAHPRLVSAILKQGMKKLNKPYHEIGLKWKTILSSMIFYMVAWSFTGTGVALCIYALTPINIQQIIFSTGSFALAAIAGLLVIFAPSGIGVRESILTLLLGTIISPALAVVVAVFARVCMSIAEILSAILVYSFYKKVDLPKP